MTRTRNIAIALAALAATAAFSVYVVGGITGRVATRFPVKVVFDHVGQLLRVTGDVKMRGVIVGKVALIEHAPDGTATVTLAIDSGQPIPAGASASIRGKTLFGEKFVELIDPAEPTGDLLEPGAVIPESRTIPPFELEQVLEALVPVLDAADPGDLGGALHALAEGLAGQEEAAGRAIDNGLKVLRAFGAVTGDLDRLLDGIDEGSDALARASPDFLAALEDLDTIARVLVANADDLAAVLRDAPDWLDVATALIRQRYTDLVDLSVKGADILELVASHRSELPFTVGALKDFTQSWVTNLSTPCEDAGGQTVAEKHPELAGSTCWQVWILSAENEKAPGGYGPEGPQPGSSVTAAAYRAQIRQMLGVPFGSQPSALTLLLHGSLRDARGLIPEALL